MGNWCIIQLVLLFYVGNSGSDSTTERPIKSPYTLKSNNRHFLHSKQHLQKIAQVFRQLRKWHSLPLLIRIRKMANNNRKREDVPEKGKGKKKTHFNVWNCTIRVAMLSACDFMKNHQQIILKLTFSLEMDSRRCFLKCLLDYFNLKNIVDI